jgi:hypothetical protein
MEKMIAQRAERRGEDMKIPSLLFVFLFSTVVPFPAWGQYSAADCTGPQVVGTDSHFSCTNGILFPTNPIPTGTFHTFFLQRKAASASQNLQFQYTAPGLGLVGFMKTEGQLKQFNPSPNTGNVNVYVASTRDVSGSFDGDCQAANGGLPIRECPTSYGRFFEIDGDGDGQFDDMEVVFIDGIAVPLNFRILFVPLNWTGTQADFDARAQAQTNAFLNATALAACLNTAEIVTLDVSTQNFNTYTCTNDNPRIGSLWQFLRSIGLGTIGYDVIVGLFPAGTGSGCGWGGITNTINTVLMDPISALRMTHEIGHCYGLADEYCSEEAGGDSRCAGSSDINFLGTDLGCDPNTGGGCCNCGNPTAPPGSQACSAACDPSPPFSNYYGCCSGNQGVGGTDGCIMSSDPSRQDFCQRCLNRLNGKTEFKCDQLPSTPFRDVLAVDLTIADAGGVTLNAVELGQGRPTRINIPGNRFVVNLAGPSGSLLNEAFDGTYFGLDVPQVETDFHYQVPIDFSPSTPPPVVLTVSDGAPSLALPLLQTPGPISNASAPLHLVSS